MKKSRWRRQVRQVILRRWREATGADSSTSSCRASLTPWDLEISGGSPTSVTGTVEVRQDLRNEQVEEISLVTRG